MNVYLDIETIPCQQSDIVEKIAQEVKPPATMKKAETIAQWEETEKPGAVLEAVQKTALDGTFGQIVCIGYAFDDGPVTRVYGKDEATILKLFFNDLHEMKNTTHTGLTFIGHNLTSFDLRFIFHRAVINGVKPPACFPINPKSWDAAIFDTMTYWAGFNGRVSLDKLCSVLGIEGKGTEFTWQDVYPAYQRGDFESIGEYCKHDVEITRKVHKRLTFQGVSQLAA